MREKTIKARSLTNKYCNEDYILNRPCFMQGCKKKGIYVLRTFDRHFFHCKSHSSKEHLRVIR